MSASVTNIIARVLGIIAALLTVYFLGRTFNLEEFGAWAWLFSIFSLVTAQDFGFISAMRVRLGLAHDHIETQQLLFAVTIWLSIAMLFLCLLTFLCLNQVVLSSRGSARIEYQFFVLAVALISVIGLCASNGLNAFLEAKWVGYAEGLRALSQVVALVFIYKFKLKFEWAVLLFYLGTLLYVPFLLTIFFKITKWDWKVILTIPFRKASGFIGMAKVLVHEGVFLWVMQLGMAFLAISDVFVAGLMFNKHEVAEVNVISKSALLGVGFIVASMGPLMGYFVKNAESLDPVNIFKKSTIVFMMFIVVGLSLSVFMFFFGNPLIYMWSRISLDSDVLFLLVGPLFVLTASVSLLHVFLQFSSFARASLKFLVMSCCLKVILTWWLESPLGVSGVFVANVASNALFLAICLYLLYKARLWDTLRSGVA